MSTRSTPPVPQPSPEEAAIRHLREAVASGQHWFPALLGSMGMWSRCEEELDGARQRYMVAQEAFDWQALGERLCAAVNGLLPKSEVEAFLTVGLPPVDIPTEEMKQLLGLAKYHGYLNYLYGVVIERCLVLATAEEVQKEWHSQCRRGASLPDELCRRVYGAGYRELLHRFHEEAGRAGHTERKEFTYWLFKLRVRTSEKARLASDTKKGLDYWRQRGHSVMARPYG
ncbi:MAG: hypothetical protein HYY01_05545 [Chloroflexi bacterium]|nr:hypothetical protein [Chloroflexota bacterium]